jgi:hypothetical protein
VIVAFNNDIRNHFFCSADNFKLSTLNVLFTFMIILQSMSNYHNKLTIPIHELNHSFKGSSGLLSRCRSNVRFRSDTQVLLRLLAVEEIATRLRQRREVEDHNCRQCENADSNQSDSDEENGGQFE